MAYLALDGKTNDLILKKGGGVERVRDGRFVLQQVRSRLRTILGEWRLDPSIGWLNTRDFEKSVSILEIEDRAREVILTTKGVLEIIELASTYSKRKLTIKFSAMTVYGSIDVEIPWETIR